MDMGDTQFHESIPVAHCDAPYISGSSTLSARAFFCGSGNSGRYAE